MATAILLMIVVMVVGVLVYALRLGNVRARLKLCGVDFVLETRDRRQR
jgi:hypothetical protein